MFPCAAGYCGIPLFALNVATVARDVRLAGCPSPQAGSPPTRALSAAAGSSNFPRLAKPRRPMHRGTRLARLNWCPESPSISMGCSYRRRKTEGPPQVLGAAALPSRRLSSRSIVQPIPHASAQRWNAAACSQVLKPKIASPVPSCHQTRLPRVRVTLSGNLSTVGNDVGPSYVVALPTPDRSGNGCQSLVEGADRQRRRTPFARVHRAVPDRVKSGNVQSLYVQDDR